MAINTLEFIALAMTALDKQIVEESTTGWMEPNASQVIYNGGREVKIPTLDMDGLADYSRDDGFTRGGVKLSYQTKEMTKDRARTFTLDSMDVNETNFVANASAVMSEFQRRHVVPEIDAYRYRRAKRQPGALCNGYRGAAGDRSCLYSRTFSRSRSKAYITKDKTENKDTQYGV